eukprot:6208352-Pleurochrysis_carterae.AAC.2
MPKRNSAKLRFVGWLSAEVCKAPPAAGTSSVELYMPPPKTRSAAFQRGVLVVTPPGDQSVAMYQLRRTNGSKVGQSDVDCRSAKPASARKRTATRWTH